MLESRVLTPAIGVEIFGLDLSKPLTTATMESLRALWHQHLVLFVKGQSITPEQQLAFARWFGIPDVYPFLAGLEGFPEITQVLKKEDEAVNFGGLWHSDTTYQATPPMATMLYAKELPPQGGDTLFANQYAAFDHLSEGMQETLRRLNSVSRAGNKAVSATRTARIADNGTGLDASTMQAVHPVVRRHPETGRDSLFVNAAHTTEFVGWTEAESEPLLRYLFDWQVREVFCCRYRWEPGDLAIWDNRCTLHYPINDYAGSRRLMHRITLKGDAPTAG